MSRPPVNPSRTFELRSSTGVVRIEIDEHGEIIWDDELRTAYEYELAFSTMGGDPSQLAKFVGQWESQDQNRLQTMLYGLPSAYAAILFAVDCIEHTLPVVDASWKKGIPGTMEALVSEALNAARDPGIEIDAQSRRNAERAVEACENYLLRHEGGTAIERYMLKSCEMVLGVELQLVRSGGLFHRITGTPHSVLTALDYCANAVAWSKKATRLKNFSWWRDKESLRQLQALIVRVHDTP